MKNTKNIIFYLITILLIFFILELIFNFLNFPPKKWSEYKKFYETYGWYTWHGANHIDGDHKLQTNGYKTRGKIPTKDKKIILLGDSSVETSQKFNLMPENFLEDFMPDYSVISMGSWGWGNDQQLLHLRENIKDIKPEKVVLWFQTNDSNDNFEKIGFLGPKPTFSVQDNKLQYPSEQMGDKTIYPYLINSYFYRALQALKSKYNKKFELDSKINNTCSENKNYDQYLDLLKIYFNKQLYERKKKISENKPTPYDRDITLFPTFEEWKKNKIESSLKEFNKNIDDIFYWSRDILSKKDKKKIQLTNLLIKEIEKISNQENSEFYLFFPIWNDLFVPFQDDKIYVICKQNIEIFYSNKNAYDKLNLIFKDIENVLIFKNEIKNWYDLFDGHANSITMKNFMKELSINIK